jgi:hypothetical protein
MSIIEKIKTYRELRRKIDELDEHRRQLGAEILELMPAENDHLCIADYQVKRIVRLSIKTSLETAKSFGAVKMQEVVDKEKIKTLYESGQTIPDVSKIQFVQIRGTPTVEDSEVS